jgi:MFS family permease
MGSAAGPRDRVARSGAAGAYFVQGMCFAALLTQVDVLKDKFGFTAAELSLVLLAVPVVAGVGSVLAGVLAARIGSAPVLRAGGIGVAAAITAVGLADERLTLYLVLSLVGLFLGLVDATMNMQGVAVQRRYGRPVLASFHGVWSVGGIAGAGATALTGYLRWPLPATLGTVAAVGAAIALAAGPRLLRRDEELAAAPDPAAAAARIPWAPIVAVGTAMMFMYIADSATSNWGSVYLHDGLHSSHSVAALALAAYQTCMVVGRALTDRLVARFGAVRTVGGGALVGAAGLMIVAAASGPAVGIAGFAVLGLGMCVVVPQSFTAADQLDPAGTGLAVARVNLFNYAGFVIGAALIGFVADTRGLRVAFVVPAVLALGIVALARTFRPRVTAPTAEVAATARG